jgi:murein DD-endopeptidase MepM/ murein hydrolase activator NlpD
MEIILVSKCHGYTKHFTLGGWTRVLLLLCTLGVPMAIGFYVGNELSRQEKGGMLTGRMVKEWKESIQQQQTAIADIGQQSKSQLTAMTLILAEQQARLLRVDALGERLTTIAKLDKGEFDFGKAPAVGGPESDDLGDAYKPPEFMQVLEQLANQIADRQQQLNTLEALMAKRKLQNDVFVAGSPVKGGWISSPFGNRTDPFNGNVSHHSGVDFAGKLGSEIVAVASGVVTYAEDDQSGYGKMVEVTHGSKFKTRYSHNKLNLVKVGDIVKKGQVIALMGDSGRSTGPHVHFEVYEDGRVTNPAIYISRNSR